MALLAAGLELTPDAVVTDIKMPRIGGIEASRELLIREAVRAVVLLTVHSDPELIKSALDAGIRGYVLKVNAGEELIPAIYEVLRGGVFISSAVRSRSDFCP
jgi:DNA-binding NarL/FixJ family response regulator